MKLLVELALLALLATAQVVRDEGQQQARDETEEVGERWAVLVAGSHKWVHYRHQASICRSYQILHDHGIPDDHIIVMMFDDIAYNDKNPIPGVIINEPNGPNVYEGVPKDYTGWHVTPNNFFKVLTGDAEGLADIGSGKVVLSGPNDRIFVNMVDGGGYLHFAFPATIMSELALKNVVLDMHQKNAYKEMIIFMESSNSGSMFHNHYPEDIGFYAVSSAGPLEPAYGMYWNETLNTWLGDTFTNAWMSDAETHDLTKETLREQFENIKEHTNTSHAHAYGQLSMQEQVVANFFGSGTGKRASLGTSKTGSFNLEKDVVRSEDDTAVVFLENHLDLAEGDDEKAYWKDQITSLYKNREFVKETINNIITKVTDDEGAAEEEELTEDFSIKVTNWDCYEKAVEAFHDNCFNLGQNHYALRTVPFQLLNLCESGYGVEEIIAVTINVCSFDSSTFTGID